MDDRRERTIFWILVAALLAATGGAYALILGPPPGERDPVVVLADEPPPPRAGPEGPAQAHPSPGRLRLAVAEVVGDVALVRGGVAAPARPGDALQLEDALVASAGARVRISGGSYGVVLEEAGQLEVGTASAELALLRLGAGYLSATVAGGALEIAAAPGASVRSERGTLSVARQGGSLAVAVREGGAVLGAAGGAVALTAGQQSLALEGRPPQAATAIASSLPLEVSWPALRRTNRGSVVVTGRTAPGAIVVIGGASVKLEPDGRFTHVIVLHEGEQRLVAHARAVGGLEAAAHGPMLVLDTHAPDARFDTQDLWEKP
ncbi:hypothetical protein [Anaeromyxobacter sp. SG17]|uniref:hypothetical protein n=1 Tax=Anaeromyxobacter sp. SG17 TaxID=2925405 RepID=UPI001F5AB12A|nr:hypothetical protein [Anaeromyxobacter sp. SG17]